MASANPATSPVGSDARRGAHGVGRPRRSGRHDGVARCAGRRRAPPPCCRPCPGPTVAPRERSGRLERPERPSGAPTTSHGRRRSARAPRRGTHPSSATSSPVPEASPRSVMNRPVSLYVRKSCGSRILAMRAHASGCVRCSHDSFVTVNAATGTQPGGRRPGGASGRPPPNCPISHPASGADSVSFHSFAGWTGWSSTIERHHAVLLAADADRIHRGDAPFVPHPLGERRAVRRLERRPPRCGILLADRAASRSDAGPCPRRPHDRSSGRGPRPWWTGSTSQPLRRASWPGR